MFATIIGLILFSKRYTNIKNKHVKYKKDKEKFGRIW